MRGKFALIGFIVLWAGMTVFWIASLVPLTGPNAPPFISEGPQIWSGGEYTSYADNFRQRATAVTSSSFQLFGTLLWATLLMLGSAVSAFFAHRFFRAGQTLFTASAIAATLTMGAGAAWFIVQQWGGGTLFPAHTVNTSWLYTLTRTLLIDLGVGYALLVAWLGLTIAEVSKPSHPLGFGYVILNWLVVVLLWVAIYVGFFVVPALTAPALAPG